MASNTFNFFNNLAERLFKQVAYFSTAKRAGMNIAVGISINVPVTSAKAAHFALMISKKRNDWKIFELRI